MSTTVAPTTPRTYLETDECRPVDRHLVHRRAIAEVFLTGATRLGSDIRVSAQWPRSNRFHLSPDARRYDELLAFETFRQACIYAAHTFFDVPADRRFVMTGASLDFHPEALTSHGRPGEVTLTLRRAPSPRHGITINADIDCDHRSAAFGRGSLLALDPRTYARLRGGRAAPELSPPGESDISPASVGRHFPQDVLVASAAAAGELLLRVDPGHPVHFDHPHDHVPGMALIDAARQAAALVHRGGPTTRIDITFDSYVELDEPCLLRSEVVAGTATTSVVTRFVQREHVKARATVVSQGGGRKPAEVE